MSGQPQVSAHRPVKVLAVTVLIVVVLGGLAAVGHRVRKRMMIQSALTEGTAAFENGDWDTARRMLGRYVSVHPENADVLVKYAEAQLAMRPLRPENIGQAIGAYRRIFNDKPADERAFRRLVLLYESAGNYADLGYVAGQRLQQVPDDPPAVIAQAKDLIYRQKATEAQAALSELIEKLTAAERFGPEYVEACVLAAGAMRLAGKPGASEAALQILTRAIEHEPQCALALVQRAALQRELAQAAAAAKTRAVPAGARADLERAEALASLDPRVQLALVREWLAQRDFARASACLAAARRLDEKAVQQYLINPADWIAGQFEVAATLALATGAAADGAALAEQALEQLKDTPQRTPLLPIALELFLAGDRIEPARQALNEYADKLELLPSMPDRAERLAYLRALIARADGQPYEVINLLEPVVDSPSTPPQANALLAEAYAKTGQIGRMAKVLSDQSAAGELGPAARKTLARWKAQHGAWNEVRALLLPLEQADPPDVEARVLLLSAELITLPDSGDASSQKLGELQQTAMTLREQYPKRVDVRLLLGAIADRQDRVDEAVAGLEGAAKECDEPVIAFLALARLYISKNQPEQAQAVLTNACQQHGTTAAPWLALSELLANNKQTVAAREALQRGMDTLVGSEKRPLAIRRASLELVDGDRAAGIPALTRLAGEEPADVRTRAMLLDLPEILQNTALAQQLIDEMKSAEGDAGLQWRFHQARLWLTASSWRAQRKEIEDLLKYCTDADPQWSAASLVLGGMYEQLAEWTKAENAYATGFRATSDVALADRWLALLQRQRRFDEAREVLGRLRQVLDERALAARRANIALGAGQYDQALTELELRATGTDRDPRDLVRLAELTYIQTRSAERAFDYLNQAAQLGAEPATVARSRVAILRSESRLDEAMAVLNDLVTVQPTPESYLLRATYFAAQGQNGLAERDFAEMAKATHDAFGPAAMGEFYARAGKLDEAIAAWEEGLQTYPDSDVLRRGLAKARLMRDAAGDRERVAQLLTELQGKSPDDTELMWIQALYQMRAGGPVAGAEVRRLLRSALTSAPAKPEVYRGLARVATQLQDTVSARDLLLRGQQTNPGDTSLLALRAWSEIELNNLPEARRIAETMINSARPEVSDWEVYVECARRQSDNKALTRAASALKKLAAITPDDERVQVLYGQALSAAGDSDGARKSLQAFHESEAGRQSLSTLITLQDLALASKDFDAAQRWIDAAGQLNAEHPTVLRGRLRLLAAQNRFDDVVQFARELPASQAEWTPDLLVSAAIFLATSPAHLNTAVGLCQRATEIAPDRIAARLALGDLSYQAGARAGAEQAYRGALQINPELPDALNNLAWVLAQEGAKIDEALALSRQAVALRPNDANYHDTLSFILRRMPDRLPEARKELQNTVDLAAPGSPLRARSLFQLAQVCSQLDEIKPIAGYLQEAIKAQNGEAIFTPAERAEIERLLRVATGPDQ